MNEASQETIANTDSSACAKVVDCGTREDRAAYRSVTQKEYDSVANLFFSQIPGIAGNPVGMLELPLAIVLGWYFRAHFRWSLLLPMAVLYIWKECVPMSVCLHRYFSHKAFKCNRGVQLALYCIGCLAAQGPCLWWASKHSRHHAHCDNEQDPHTPVKYSRLYAWLGCAYID